MRPPAPHVLSALVRGFVGEERAEGASLKTVRTYADALERVLVPNLVADGVEDVAGTTNVALKRLTSGLLDGTASRSGRPMTRASASTYGRTINVWLAWAAKQSGTSQAVKAKLLEKASVSSTPTAAKRSRRWRTRQRASATS